jgi:16S rRNA (uracil1498-N3)-methyltransferase
VTPPRLFCPLPLSAGIELALPEEAAHHAVRVLRLRVGDWLTLFSGDGAEYEAQIAGVAPRAVSVRLLERRVVERESPLKVTLVQALIAAERMDYVVQKAVELGVTAIVPVATVRGVTRLDGPRAQRRLEHWRQIVIAACEQCGRSRLARIEAPCELREWLRCPSDARTRLLLAPEAALPLGKLSAPAGTIELVVGPEGGFAPEEQAQALAAGFQAVRLGPRTLRTETAAPAALAAMAALWGDWR